MAPSVKRSRERRRRGSLTRDQVVEAALQLADERGIDVLTMPNLARRLGCGVMTLYGYVESKEVLLNLMTQRGLADLRLPRPLPQTAEGVLVSWGRELRRTLAGHPSLAVIFLTRSVLGPGTFRGVEALLGALGRAGMPAADAARAIYAVVVFTTGFVAWEIPRTRFRPEGWYAAEWRRQFAMLPPEQFPATAGVLGELAQVASEQQFELGLGALARGLAPAP